MSLTVRAYGDGDIAGMIRIWNEIVEDGIAFPQEDPLTPETGRAFFAEQSYCGVACDGQTGQILGMYILHPNNVGRCGHIANASYGVASEARGRHVGEALVKDCLRMTKKLGFRLMQFNAVVRTNAGARHLYEKLGFIQLGVIPGGFRMKDGHYEDIVPYYHELKEDWI